jgi:hypothetical protein
MTIFVDLARFLQQQNGRHRKRDRFALPGGDKSHHAIFQRRYMLLRRHRFRGKIASLCNPHQYSVSWLLRRLLSQTIVLRLWPIRALHYRCALATLSTLSLPLGAVTDLDGGEYMKIVHLCYAALGFAVARWIFKREPMPMTDPVTRFRSSGLL